MDHRDTKQVLGVIGVVGPPLPLKNVKKECNILLIILVQGFCPLKIKITQFLGGFRLNSPRAGSLSLASFFSPAAPTHSGQLFASARTAFRYIVNIA